MSTLHYKYDEQGRKIKGITEYPVIGKSKVTVFSYKNNLLERKVEYDKLGRKLTYTVSSETNHLIRNRKAQLVMTADDIVRELMWDLGPEPAAFREKPSTPELTPDEAGLLGCFRTDDPLAVETLAELSGLEPGELAALLVGLELAGAVRQLPGNRYMKTR